MWIKYKEDQAIINLNNCSGFEKENLTIRFITDKNYIWWSFNSREERDCIFYKLIERLDLFVFKTPNKSITFDKDSYGLR